MYSMQILAKNDCRDTVIVEMNKNVLAFLTGHVSLDPRHWTSSTPLRGEIQDAVKNANKIKAFQEATLGVMEQ